MRIEAYLRESPIFTVKSLSRRFDSLASEVFSKSDLGLTEGLVLAAIFFEDPKPAKPALLADTFNMTRGAISHIISNIEGKGLVIRKIDPSDARAYLITLKPAGKKAAMNMITVFDALQTSFEKKVGKRALESALNLLRDL